MVLETEVDQITPTSDALENVLDVMAQSGDRLTDCCEALGMNQGPLVPLPINCQRRLVADRHQQPQGLLAEAFSTNTLFKTLADMGRCIQVDDPQNGLTANQGSTDRLSNTGLQDAATAGKPFVLLRVRSPHPLTVSHHEINDTSRNRHHDRTTVQFSRTERHQLTPIALGRQPFTVHTRLWNFRVLRRHQDASPVSRHNLQRDIKDRDQDVVKCHFRVNHRLADPIQRRQARQRFRFTQLPSGRTAAFGGHCGRLTFRPVKHSIGIRRIQDHVGRLADDTRPFSGSGHHVNRNPTLVADCTVNAKTKQGAGHLQLVSVDHTRALNRNTVEQCSVRTVEIHQNKAGGLPLDCRMKPRRLLVENPYRILGTAADADSLTADLVAGASPGAFDDKQIRRRHDPWLL